MTAVMATIIGLVFLRIGGNSQKSIQDREGAILFVLVNLGFSGIQAVVATFAPLRAIFFKEYLSKQYGVSHYYFATLAIKIPVQIITPLIFVSITYWLIGFQASAGNFFYFLGVIMLIVLTMNAAGFAIAGGAADVQGALTLVPITILPLILLGGFFLNSASVPKYLIWVQYMSPFKYGTTQIPFLPISNKKLNCKQITKDMNFSFSRNSLV